ncbi:MAG TPA: HAMP domain-containing sensor histidine kinase [Streptosporangiaceae bacterium]
MSTPHHVRRLLPRALAVPDTGSRRKTLREAASRWRAQAVRWWRSSRVDIIWVGFVGLNLVAMRVLPAWQTVPFLAIWVSLTVIYGFRLWRLQPTILTLAAVTLATGGIIGVQVLRGQEDADYLAEVPLIALMFLVMVWHGRRRLAAMEERLAAMDEVERVSQENMRLLKQQRRFLQDASHELGTPITVALGHAELIERSVTNSEVAADARVVTDELMRLRRLATRMLLLASVGRPDFLQWAPVGAESVVTDALERWGHMPRRWRLGSLAEVTVLGDRDRLAVALDALLENAIAHTAPEDRIEVSARLENGHVVLAVTDSGCGIPATDLERIFHRFARGDPPRSREGGGFGLGLAIVQAIVTAHHGSVRVQSTVGQGSTFEMLLPLAPVWEPIGQRASGDPETSRQSSPDAQIPRMSPSAGDRGSSG